MMIIFNHYFYEKYFFECVNNISHYMQTIKYKTLRIKDTCNIIKQFLYIFEFNESNFVPIKLVKHD